MTVKKRPWWRGWIPAAGLVVILVGVGIATSVMINNGLGQPAPKPTEGQVTDLNWSSFSEDGLDYIARTRQVRIDMSTQPVDAAAIGLTPDDTLVLERIDTGDTLLDYDLIINGGGEGFGGGRFVVTDITIVTQGGVVTSVSAPLRDVVNFRQTLDMLTEKAEIWGWDTAARDEAFAIADQATRDGVPYEFTFGPADKAGVPMAATASCDTSGFCAVTYTATPATE